MPEREADHPNVVGKAERLQGGDASKAHGMSFAGKKYSATGKTGNSFHDGTPVRHFRESGNSSGEDVWLDGEGRVHADSNDDVQRLRERYEALAGGGHTIPAGPVRHEDSESADRWYADLTEKMMAAGYVWLGFTVHGATWHHPEYGDLHVQHGISNPADRSDTAIYSNVVQGDKGVSIVDTLGGPQEVTDESLKQHPMWSTSDFDYFMAKGYTPAEIKVIWDRDHRAGKGPVQHDKAPDVVGTFAKKAP